MSDIYLSIHDDCLHAAEREEPTARYVARQAIAARQVRRLREWMMFLFGFAAGAWAAALLAGWL